MGVVFEARQTRLNRRVAIKMLLSGAWHHPDLRNRLQAEAAAAAQLRHPGIVTIHEVGMIDGQPFIAMELVEGPSLADLVRQKPLAAARAARYLELVAQAVAHAHTNGILHRDLKPSNILIDPGDQPRITDFGLAKQLDAQTALTRPGDLLGSPAYLPPEQVRSGSSTTAGDVYSLGAVLYELLTGRPPFVADNVAAVLHQVTSNPPLAPRWLQPGIPRDLETICLKCLHKEPQRRYASAADLAEDLARFARGQPIRARSTPMYERAWLWARRNPALATLSFLLVLALAGGFLGVLQQWREARESRDAMSRNLYAADVAAAAHALAEGNTGRARSLLEPYRNPEGNPRQPTPDFTLRLLLHRSRSDELSTLGHLPWIVTSVTVSPDGRWIAAGSQDRPDRKESTLRLWDRRSPATEPASLPVSNTVWSVNFTSDSSTLVSSGANGTEFWIGPQWSPHPSFPRLPGEESTLASNRLVLSPNHPFFRTTNPAPLLAFDLKVHRLETLPFRGWHPALSPDGRRLAFLDPELDIELVDAVRGTPLATVAKNNLQFRLRFSPDGQRLVASGQSTTARIWDLTRPGSSPLRFPSTHNVWDSAFSPDGATLITATSHQHIELWEASTAHRLGSLVGHSSEVWALATTPDGRNIVSGGKDQSVRLWPMHPRPAPVRIPSSRHARPMPAPDGQRCLVVNPDPGPVTTTLWHWTNGPTGERTTPIALGTIRGHAVGMAPDNLHALILSDDLTQLEWQVPDKAAPSRTIRLEPSPNTLVPSAFLVSGDGRSAVCADVSGMVHRWSTADGRSKGRWTEPDFNLAWKNAIATGTHTNRLLRAVAIDRSGRWLAMGLFGSADGILADLDSGRATRLSGHHDDIAALAFAPDGSSLASGSIDGSIRMWSLPDGHLIAVLPGHQEAVEALDISPDGQTLVSASVGVELTFWHIPTQRELARLPHPDVSTQLRFSPEGRRLLIGVSDGGTSTARDQIEIWDAP